MGIQQAMDLLATRDFLRVTALHHPRSASSTDTVGIDVIVECHGGGIAGACEAAVEISASDATFRRPQTGTVVIPAGERQRFHVETTMPATDLEIETKAIEVDVDGEKVTDTANGVVRLREPDDPCVGLLDQPCSVVTDVAGDALLWGAGGALIGAATAEYTGEELPIGTALGAGSGIVLRQAAQTATTPPPQE